MHSRLTMCNLPCMQAQVCAAGALLNILGPELDRGPQGPAQRQGLARLMSSALALSIIHDAMFDAAPASHVAVQ